MTTFIEGSQAGGQAEGVQHVLGEEVFRQLGQVVRHVGELAKFAIPSSAAPIGSDWSLQQRRAASHNDPFPYSDVSVEQIRG